MPQVKEVRDTHRSCRPGSKKLFIISFLRDYRLDEFGMGVDMLNQAIRIFAHLEEVGFFLRGLYFSAAVRTLAVYQLGFGEEGFAGGAIHAFVIALVDITLVVQFLERSSVPALRDQRL